MPKPRRVKLDNGVILMNGFPKEVANELEVYLSKFKRAEIPVGSVTVEVKLEEPKAAKVFLDKSLGLKLTNGRYKVVIVGYDLDSNESSIEETKDAGDFKQHALSVFQQEIFKRGLV